MFDCLIYSDRLIGLAVLYVPYLRETKRHVICIEDPFDAEAHPYPPKLESHSQNLALTVLHVLALTLLYGFDWLMCYGFDCLMWL